MAEIIAANMTANTYDFFPASSLYPAGWLLCQLRTEAEGLAGHLDLIWPDVRDSKWIGGDREGWERVPYWLDGFIPLAYLLRDGGMIARAQRYVRAILDGQAEDGWICPCPPEGRAGYDMWALLLISKVLVLYASCEPSEAARVETALVRAFRQAAEHLEAHPLFDWGKYRWFEGLIAVNWLYQRTGGEWLLDFADLLHAQGRDYVSLIDREFSAYEQPERKWQWDTHVVNLAMALKAEGLWQKRLGTPASDCGAFPLHMLETLMQHHGMPCGHFTGDECLAGRSPIQGTELCGVVEAMYSYEVLLALTGTPLFGDLLERAALNALPAATSPDLWTHQYDQQINQAACAPETEASVFGTNGREANVFGLEPNYGCCTANMPQGWPKLAMTVFLRRPGGILAALPLPARVETELDGIPVSVVCSGGYPFRDTVTYTVSAGQPVQFALDVRIPGTAASAELDGQPVKPGTIVTLNRIWSGTKTLTLTMSFDVTLDPAGYGDLMVVNRGPLLFAVPIEAVEIVKEYTRDGVERRAPYCDRLLYPAGHFGWLFAAGADAAEVLHPSPVPDDTPVFSPEQTPLAISMPLVPVDWGKKEGFAFCAADLPASREPLGKARRVTMIPYGATMLRMTAMPMC